MAGVPRYCGTLQRSSRDVVRMDVVMVERGGWGGGQNGGGWMWLLEE